jgi:xanthine dehydrogenase accessory factor
MKHLADHHNILNSFAAWRGGPMALATVLTTWRSAPCPVGTHMLIHGDGRFTGSVSGGCVESDVLQLAAEIIAGAPFQVRRYGVADVAAWEVGLPCGGEIAVLIQRVDSAGYGPGLFDAILAARAAGETVSVATDLETGLSTRGVEGDFINLYAPPKRLIIVGAVEIARTLAGLAAQLGIAVTVVDPRERFLTADRFPDVARDNRWPDDAITALRPDSRTAIVTLSHDPKIDDPALIAALANPTGYIAALGSRTSHAARIARLRGLGVSEAQLARIEGPAGAHINAISAPEIALSIAAGLVRAFNDGLR